MRRLRPRIGGARCRAPTTPCKIRDIPACRPGHGLPAPHPGPRICRGSSSVLPASSVRKHTVDGLTTTRSTRVGSRRPRSPPGRRLFSPIVRLERSEAAWGREQPRFAARFRGCNRTWKPHVAAKPAAKHRLPPPPSTPHWRRIQRDMHRLPASGIPPCGAGNPNSARL